MDPAERPRDLKIMVATPVHSDIKVGCAWSLFHAAAHFASLPYDGKKELTWEVCKSSQLTAGRTRLVSRAVLSEATHILWIDSDIKVPFDVIARLLNHGKLIVGANYPTKEVESRPTAYRDDDEYVGPVWTKPDSTGLESVLHLGFGCLLTDITVFDRIDLPYFQFDPVPPNYLMSTGEDVYCCKKWKKAGFDIWVDHDLSQQIIHIGDWDYDNHKSWIAQQTKLELYAKIDTTAQGNPA